jgi:hypothetical protein
VITVAKFFTVYGAFDIFQTDDSKLDPEKLEKLRSRYKDRQVFLDAIDEENEFVRIQEGLGIDGAKPHLPSEYFAVVENYEGGEDSEDAEQGTGNPGD